MRKRCTRHLAVIFLLAAPMCLADSATVKVRLYSLHSEQRLKITAKTGDLTWKSCVSCHANHATTLTLQPSRQGIIINEGRTEKNIHIAGDYRIEPAEGLTLELTYPLEVRSEPDSLKAFLTLSLEDYVAAAVAGESGSFQHAESLKAMAVAVRTYAVHFRGRHASEGFDFCDSTHCQTLNFKGITAAGRNAASDTRGEMLWYQGSPAATFYHQNCGGSLAAVQESWPDMRAPYLKHQSDPYCVRGAQLLWKAQLTHEQLQGALKAQGLSVPPDWHALEIVSRTASGRAAKLEFRVGPREPRETTSATTRTQSDALQISASTLRFAIGRSLGWNRVRSDLYQVESNGDSVIFTGRGAGHGVGLCQAGAEEMAKEGQDYRQILAFYYPGASLGTTAQGMAWQKREGEGLEMLSTEPDQDAEALRAAESILPVVESEVGWKLDFKPQLKIYPSLDTYRDATGQAGWIAAFSRGHSISLQPLAILKKKSILESTLRHEFAHLLIEGRARAGTPLWFREGLVLYFADPKRSVEPVQASMQEMEQALSRSNNREELERAYAAARTKVQQMVQQNGKETVLLWLTNGLPEESGRHPD